MKFRLTTAIALILLGIALGSGASHVLERRAAHLVRVYGAIEKGCRLEWEMTTRGLFGGGVLDGGDTIACNARYRADADLTFQCVCP